MRIQLLSLLSCLPFIPVSFADDAQKVKEIVDRAITAHAGSGEKLDKLKRIEYSSNGTMKTVQGVATASRTVRIEWGVQPEYYQNSVHLELSDRKVDTQLILVGMTKGRQSFGTTFQEMPADQVGWMNRDVYSYWVASLLPLRDGGLTLSLLPASKVENVAVVGIKAEKRDRPTVELYFETQTGLLKKIGYPGLEAGVEMRKELIYGDYKVFDGIKMPTKEFEYHDGRKCYEWINADYKFPEKIERK